MFFEKRRWALRVTERMGLDPKDPTAAELVDMMMQGAEQQRAMVRQMGGRLSKGQAILMAAAAMSDNRSAKQRMVDAGMHPGLLKNAFEAGRQLAAENGFAAVVAYYDRFGK